MVRSWLCALALLSALPAASPAQAAVGPDCCALLFSTGRWLGWTASFLEYTREREAPSPADGPMLQGLRLAGNNAEAANRSCLQGLQAWPDWRQKQLWLANQIAELQRPSDPVKSHKTRRQLAQSAIGTTYDLWGRELSRQRLDGDLLQQPTCATLYFKLGFDLAYATQAFRQADEALQNRSRSTDSLMRDRCSQAALRQLNQTRLRLSKARAVLQSYGDTCADIGLDGLKKMIQYIAGRPPSFSSYQQELQIVSSTSDRIGQLLLANCAPNQGQGHPPEPAPPGAKDPDELAGDWVFESPWSWDQYIGPVWRSNWLPKFLEQQRAAMVVRFERGGDDYTGTIVRPPSGNAKVPFYFDAWGGRNHLFQRGMVLLRMRKIAKNLYRGDYPRVGIPGPNSGFENGMLACEIVVYGDAAKFLSLGNSPQRAQWYPYGDRTGSLILRYPVAD